MTIIDGLARAIARMEGWASGASKVAVENNNPGNLRAWAKDSTIRNGYVAFPSLAAGVTALNKVITDYVTGRYEATFKNKFGQGYATPGSPTLREIFATYAPSDDKNNPGKYAENVATWLGISPDVPVKNVGWGESNATLAEQNTKGFNVGSSGGSTVNPTPGKPVQTTTQTTTQASQKKK